MTFFTALLCVIFTLFVVKISLTIVLPNLTISWNDFPYFLNSINETSLRELRVKYFKNESIYFMSGIYITAYSK